MSDQVSSALRACRGCSRGRANPAQYAALDAMCKAGQPGVVVESTAMSHSEQFTPGCVYSEWSHIATQMCILRRFGFRRMVVVNFIGHSSGMIAQITQWSEVLCDDGSFAIVVIVEQTGEEDGSEYSIRVCGGARQDGLTQGEMLSGVVSICESQQCVMWYWEATEELHQVYTSQHCDSVWVGSPLGRYPSSSGFIVPRLLSNPSLSNCVYVSLSSSYSCPVRSPDEDTRVQLQLNTVSREVLSGVCGSGRCYSCELLVDTLSCASGGRPPAVTVSVSSVFAQDDSR